MHSQNFYSSFEWKVTRLFNTIYNVPLTEIIEKLHYLFSNIKSCNWKEKSCLKGSGIFERSKVTESFKVIYLKNYTVQQL